MNNAFIIHVINKPDFIDAKYYPQISCGEAKFPQSNRSCAVVAVSWYNYIQLIKIQAIESEI